MDKPYYIHSFVDGSFPYCDNVTRYIDLQVFICSSHCSRGVRMDKLFQVRLHQHFMRAQISLQSHQHLLLSSSLKEIFKVIFSSLKLFIFGCTSLLHSGFIQFWRVGTTLSLGAWASHCGDFLLLQSMSSSQGRGLQQLQHRGSIVMALRPSVCRLQQLQHAGSVVVVHGLSCSSACLPGPGIKPMSPALTGRFLSTAPPVRS